MVGTPLPNLIIGNTITGTLEAGLISYASNTIVAENKVSGLSEQEIIGAFHLYHAHNIQLLNNEVTSSKNGILLLFSPDNQIKGNRIDGALYGLTLFKSDNNTIENNIFSSNDHNAILKASNNNVIQFNSFYKKQYQALDDDENLWRANYWDDYTGTDINGDGMGDTANITSEAVRDESPKKDPYPLKGEIVPELAQLEIKDAPWTNESVNQNTTWDNCNKMYEPSKISIEAGATLTINNCTISVENGILFIDVKSGGGLTITNSTVGGDGLHSYILIRMEKDASLMIRSSKIYYAGDWGGGSGIQLYGNGAIIENNEIVGNYLGVDVRDSYGHRIIGNKISDCVDGIWSNPKASDIVIENNEISSCFYPEVRELLNIK